ncbi:MAG: hypothetical protein JXA08_04895 [Methanomicrobiaceae archaeon]|nr:hypothetical protein [Methanomicrobiaceae archaeon]
MSSKKHLTIGITVNLEHYENLRLDVEGEVETQEDADRLVAYLDGVLAGMGRDDPDTMKRVDSYRRRVLGQVPQAAPAAAPSPAVPPEKPERPLVAENPVIEAIPNGSLTESLYHTPADAPCVGEDADHAGERAGGGLHETCNAAVPSLNAHPPESVKPPEKPPGKTAAEIECSACGEKISKTQNELSQLLMDKSFCKKCMDKQMKTG